MKVLDGLAALFVVGVFWLPAWLAGLPGSAAGLPAWLASGDSWAVPVGVLLGSATGLAMLARRRHPAAATAVAAAATVTGSLLGVTADPMLGAAWCLYPLALGAVSSVPVVTGLVMGLGVVTVVPDHDRQLLVSVVALTASWLLGATVSRQVARAHVSVAREVHDVVGHALSVIGAEAGVTRSLPDVTEAELRAALVSIESQARESLAEVQSLVRSLRDPSAPAPAPGLAELGALLTAVESAGVRLKASTDTSSPLEPPVSNAAFRIVQESLNNVVRHAPGSTCTVDVHVEGGDLAVRVADDGPGAAAAAGSGLTGMRERVSRVGGTITWGDRPSGGFEVAARLPLTRARRP